MAMLACEGMRRGDYTNRKVRCLGAGATRLGYGKWEASRGDVIVWRVEAVDGSMIEFSGRMLGRVDAAAEGPEVPAVKGWIAVLELNATFHHAFVRWVDPAWVTEIRDVPKVFPAWFFGELPSTEKILAANAYGSLSDHYVERAKAEGRL